HLGEVSEAKEGGCGVSPGKIPRPNAVHLLQRRGTADALQAARRERRGNLGTPLRAVGEEAEGQGFGLHHEQGRAKAWLDLQKKSLGASERDEQRRGAWREHV
ncbi:MAG: hypothetical protein AVDCRST_MAG28-157, partial [uncultured Rubrobacteraceae bacterium]